MCLKWLVGVRTCQAPREPHRIAETEKWKHAFDYSRDVTSLVWFQNWTGDFYFSHHRFSVICSIECGSLTWSCSISFFINRFFRASRHNGDTTDRRPPASVCLCQCVLVCLLAACPASPKSYFTRWSPHPHPSTSLTEGNPKVMLIGWESVENATVISPGIRRTIAFSGTPSRAIKGKLQQNNSFSETCRCFFSAFTRLTLSCCKLCLDPYLKIPGNRIVNHTSVIT